MAKKKKNYIGDSPFKFDGSVSDFFVFLRQSIAKKTTQEAMKAAYINGSDLMTLKDSYSYLTSITDEFNALTEEFKKICDAMPKSPTADIKAATEAAGAAMDDYMPRFMEVMAKFLQVSTIVPYIQEELKSPQYTGITMDNLFENDEAIVKEIFDRASAALNKEAYPSKSSPRELAISKGAIITLGGAIASFSSEDLKNSFNSFSLVELANPVENYSFDDSGRLIHYGLSENDCFNVNDIDTSALSTILQAVIKTTGNEIVPGSINTKVQLYLPSIMKELKFDPRGFEKDRANKNNDYSQLYFEAFSKKILPFERFIGRLPNGSYYRVLSISSYDAESQTIVLDTPYMFKALEIALHNKELNNNYVYLNELFFPEVINERNHAAVELAKRITDGLLQRGFTNPKFREVKDGETQAYYEYKIKYSTLIKDCPQLEYALSSLESRQAKNSKLKSTFNAAIRIIMKKTNVPTKYKNIIFGAAPSTSVLDANFIITYTK